MRDNGMQVASRRGSLTIGEHRGAQWQAGTFLSKRSNPDSNIPASYLSPPSPLAKNYSFKQLLLPPTHGQLTLIVTSKVLVDLDLNKYIT